MTNDSIRRKRALLYGSGILAVVLLVGTALYLVRGPVSPDTTATVEARPRPARVAVATAQPSPVEQAALSQNQIDRAVHLIGDARRFAAAGNFAEADNSLKQADEAAPSLPEMAQARREIAEMRTPQGQLAILVAKAHGALERGDYAAADQAIGEAERLDAQAAEVTKLRHDLQAARETNAQKAEHLTSLLTAMRTALARKDFAAANRALNEAERLDIHSPHVLEARAELNKAQRD